MTTGQPINQQNINGIPTSSTAVTVWWSGNPTTTWGESNVNSAQIKVALQECLAKSGNIYNQIEQQIGNPPDTFSLPAGMRATQP